MTTLTTKRLEVRGRDFINQIPVALELDVSGALDFARQLMENVILNVEETAIFERILKCRFNSAGLTTLVAHGDSQYHALEKLCIVLQVTKEGVRPEEAILFLRELMLRLLGILDHLKIEEITLTPEMRYKILEGSAEINWMFEIYEHFAKGHGLNASAIPNFFLHLLSLFVIGEAAGISTTVQHGRTELAAGILGQLRSPTLQLYVLRHLIDQIQAYLSRVSLGLRNFRNHGVVSSWVMNTLFSFLRLLEGHVSEIVLIEDDDIKSLEVMERVAGTAFPAFPIISIVIASVVVLAKKVSEKPKKRKKRRIRHRYFHRV